jgi:hypothetical protein
VRLPEEMFLAAPAPSARQILQAAGIDLSHVTAWTLYGTSFDAGVFAAVLDQPIPPRPVGADPDLCVHVAAPRAQAVSDSMPPPTAGPGDVAHIFNMIDTEWVFTMQLEKQLVLLRKQLSGMHTRITTLDRDLSPEEGAYADRQAKNDWQEARRWLKDSAAKLTRYIKEHDTGETSSAGKREWFINTYQQLVRRRQPVENLVQLHRDFESHRKRLQILQTNMTNALQFAGSDGERRAQTVLERIARSVRDKRAKQRGRRENEPIRKKHLDS